MNHNDQGMSHETPKVGRMLAFVDEQRVLVKLKDIHLASGFFSCRRLVD
ncbi:MAG: hypothetical protein IBJ12_12955 [Sphingomonadaceae bacterium]|nr:hypothetical protein [Sphingomonadaceae bacterium]